MLDIVWKYYQRKPDSKRREFKLGFKVNQTEIAPGFKCYSIQDRSTHELMLHETAFLTQKSVGGAKPNSVKNLAEGLKYYCSFSKVSGVQMNEALVAGKRIQKSTLERMRDFIRAKAHQNLLVLPNSSFGNSPAETNRLMGQIKRYVVWCVERYHENPVEEIKAVKKWFRDLKLADRRDGSFRVLKQSTLGCLWKAFDLGHGFGRSKLDRLRNRCMFQVGYESGGRISELLLIRVDDIVLGPKPSVYLKMPGSEDIDGRKDVPGFKTFARCLNISRQLADLLKQYLSLRPGRHNTTCVFVSHYGKTKGKPLSLRQAHNLMAQASSYVPGLLRNIRWHDIRHTVLYRIYRALPNDDNRKDKIKEIAGHVSDSAFFRYNRLALWEEANEQLSEINATYEKSFMAKEFPEQKEFFLDDLI
ncbi:MAG: site-specific integrase [Desulfuromonadales bacterium]|nr:site-specific integrase [Desulfuromonadales bacterium]